MKLLISSDGTKQGTKLVSGVTGEEIDDITEITWTINGKDGFSCAIVKFAVMRAEITAEVTDETELHL